MYPTDPQPSFIRRHWLLICVCALGAIGLTAWSVKFMASPKQSGPRKQDFSMVQITLPPPPPPPPPPPREEPQPRNDETPDSPREMVAQEPVAADQPESPPEEAAAEASMGTNVQSDGPADGFGLVGRGSGGIIGGGGTLGGQSRSGGGRWGWYAAQIQRSVEDAIKQHEKTRTAALLISVRIWPDANGRIERAQLTRSTGNAELDKTLVDEVLTGIQLRDAPPADMPLPITMRITAQRPN